MTSRSTGSGVLTVDPAQRRVTADGTEVTLTATEFDLLVHLVRRPGRVYEREQLLSQVWGYEAAAGTRTVDVHVAQLRAKLGDASPIRTVRGVGYSAQAPRSTSTRHRRRTRTTVAEPRVRMRDRLATRVTLVSLTVAFIAVLIAGLVSLGLVRGAAQEQARSTLARQADLVATALDRGTAREAALTTLLRRQQVTVDVVAAGPAGARRT